MKLSDRETALMVQMIIHDLDKPTMIAARILERLCRGRYDLSNASHMRILEGARAALSRSGRMLVDLGDVMKNKEFLPRVSRCPVADLVDEAAVNFSGMAEGEEIRFSANCRGHGTLNTDPDLFMRILENYLYNALNHTEPGGWIQLEADARTDGHATIFVANQGPVIESTTLETIFEPGVQLELRRNRKWRGSGLGLAFCKMAAESMDMAVNAKVLPDNAGMAFYVETGRQKERRPDS